MWGPGCKKDVDGCDLKRDGEVMSLSFQLDCARQLGRWQHIPCPLPQPSLGAGRLVPRALTGAGKGQAMLELKERASLFWLVGSQHLDDSWVSRIRQADTLHGIESHSWALSFGRHHPEEAMGNGNKWTVNHRPSWLPVLGCFFHAKCGPAFHLLVYLNYSGAPE